MTTAAPSRPSRSAIENPIPWVEAVTTATLPSSLRGVIILVLYPSCKLLNTEHSSSKYLSLSLSFWNNLTVNLLGSRAFSVCLSWLFLNSFDFLVKYGGTFRVAPSWRWIGRSGVANCSVTKKLANFGSGYGGRDKVFSFFCVHLFFLKKGLVALVFYWFLIYFL